MSQGDPKIPQKHFISWRFRPAVNAVEFGLFIPIFHIFDQAYDTEGGATGKFQNVPVPFQSWLKAAQI